MSLTGSVDPPRPGILLVVNPLSVEVPQSSSSRKRAVTAEESP